MFIPTLLMITKTWKPPTCPSTDECIKMWYIYTMDYYSVVSDPWPPHGLLARILESVAVPSSRGSSQPRNRTRVSCIAGSFPELQERGEGIHLEVRINRYILLYIKLINNNVLL